MSDESDHKEARGEAVGYQAKSEAVQNFLKDLEEERSRLSEDFPICALLIEEAFDLIYSTGRLPGREFHADVLKQRPIRLIQKVYIPVKQYPKFNFIGKILGPRGNSLLRLQNETQCRITLKGRTSKGDKAKEEELRQSGDSRFRHLNKDLFLEISTVATPAECYARIAYALAEVRKYLIPDKNDEISHEQLREIMEIDPDRAKAGYGGKPELYKSVFDKPGRSKGTPKYLDILKQTSTQSEELEDEREYKNIGHHYVIPKRAASPNGYEYIKVPSSSKGYKRTGEPIFERSKYVREVSSSKPYSANMKPHLYGILKKYNFDKN